MNDKSKQPAKAQGISDKCEYHYDNTDCVCYNPHAQTSCPITCGEYRNGWNDAMNYIFKGGLGYRPYMRGHGYERPSD